MPVKILVVDDEAEMQPLMQQRFRRHIREGLYSFRFANNGQEALDRIGEDADLDVLLLDINMPDIDGLTLLNQVTDRLPNSRAVMVSAYGDIQNIRTAMNRGAFDFVTKPINFQDLELTIEKTARHVGQLRDSIRVKAVSDLKARFFDNITHEFRTPLSLILAPVETLLGEDNHNERTRRHLTTVRRSAHQLLDLINQLLDLAKLEAGSLPVSNARGDVVAFVEQTVDGFQAMAAQKAIGLTFSAHVPTLDTFFDADKWGKILINLLANALKFTPAGGHVTVALHQPDAMIIRLTVHDTGIGIDAEHLPRIFDRFYQVDSSLTRAYEGSGIGLALANELAGRMGGQITVTSTPGGQNGGESGTTFTVVLPLQQATGGTSSPTTEPVADVPAPRATQATPTDDAGPDDDQPLLLVVEDNAELLAFVADALADQYRVLTAPNGRAGLDIARRELPDLVVSDLMMPEMDGYELTRHLKTDPATDHIAVVLLTARSAQQQRLDGLAGGADDYLTKPFDLAELRLRLRNIARRQQTLRDYYHRQSRQATPPPASPPEPTVQDLFLQKLHQIIEAHLDDSAFRAESLADEVAMSIRNLTRKLCTLAGESPARLIRTYRLRRATDLLRAGHPVAETAYMVGFEHPANFATAFKEVYSQTPTEFLTSHR